jgi:arylsulfatase A-like enzyme
MTKYSRRSFIKFTGLGAAALMAPEIATGKSDVNKRPNIIFILVDDMGWMDSSLYGSKYYETPNVERLARRGMMFTDAYAASPVCSPTRASILTGKYPCRLKITGPAGHLLPQPDTPLIKEFAAPRIKMVCPRSRRFLRLEEYTIAEAFKDAGYKTGFIGKWHLGRKPWWPDKQGFDINIAGGHSNSAPSYFSPYRIKTLRDGPRGEYLTDRLTDEALKYLDEHRDKPFFLSFWHYAVHAPFQAKDELIKKYRGKNDPRGKQNCPIMGAMLQSMDENLGRLLDKLDELKIADKTIIIFTSDNGGNMYDEVEETTPTNNYPLRGGKGTIYEGGTRVPCIVVWPDVVRPGTKCSEVISSIDFYPTMLEMAGIEKKKDHQTDGESIVPLLKGTGKLKREAIFCHTPNYKRDTAPPSTYVRKGDWKLIRFYGEGPNRSYAFELYNLRDDIGETKNLADKMPEKVRELDALITVHLKDTGAIIPFPNPRYNPKVKAPVRVKPVHG